MLVTPLAASYNGIMSFRFFSCNRFASLSVSCPFASPRYVSFRLKCFVYLQSFRIEQSHRSVLVVQGRGLFPSRRVSLRDYVIGIHAETPRLSDRS
jgi:hypothetical protein